MAYDEGLAERIREILQPQLGLDEKKMFGGIAFMINDYMFCGIAKGELMVRVGAENYEAALTEPHVRPMNFTGKPLKGYVYVDAEGFAEDADLKQWVDRAMAFVATLPPKQGKSKKGKGKM